MDSLVVDTNVIVRYLKTVDGILAEIMGHYKMLVSSVTVAELLATNRANNQEAHKQIRDFINENFEVLPITREAAVKAGDLLRELDITLAHACVAATAMGKGLPLLTYEIKTYDRIPDLQLIDI